MSIIFLHFLTVNKELLLIMVTGPGFCVSCGGVTVMYTTHSYTMNINPIMPFMATQSHNAPLETLWIVISGINSGQLMTPAWTLAWPWGDSRSWKGTRLGTMGRQGVWDCGTRWEGEPLIHQCQGYIYYKYNKIPLHCRYITTQWMYDA